MLKCREVIIDSIEKTVDASLLNRYFLQAKCAYQQFSKQKQHFTVSFQSHQEAKNFIHENAMRLKVLKRVFNIYFAFLLDVQNTVCYQFSGINQDNLRKAFEICEKHGDCRLKIQYERQKLNFRCHAYFAKKSQLQGETEYDIKWLEQSLLGLNIKIRCIDPEQLKNQFTCSIQFTNFTNVENIQLSEDTKQGLKSEVRKKMAECSHQDVKTIQILTFLHKESIPSVKAYLKYHSPQITITAFQSLRASIINESSSIQAKLFYFQHQANTFRTLFSSNLIKPQKLTEKQFQNQLLINFRQIEPNITQILTKEMMGHAFTAKIYLKDEQSGKNLILEHPKNRKHIFQYYKDKSNIVINIFQSLESMAKIRKQQDNADRILNHFKHTKLREEMLTPKIISEYPQKQYPHNNKPHYNHYKEYNNREQPKEQRQPDKKVKYRQAQKKYKVIVKKQQHRPLKSAFSVNEQDFPSMP